MFSLFLSTPEQERAYGKAPNRADRRSYVGIGVGSESRHAIAAAGGDAVVALLTALARNAELERELALSREAVSNGFSRGWHKARR